MANSEIISRFGVAVRRLRHDQDISQAKLAESRRPGADTYIDMLLGSRQNPGVIFVNVIS
jgi:hypothetical protein